MLASVLGSDRVHFSVGCDGLPGITRTYESLRACSEEIGMSRIYGGIHFPSANRNGLNTGKVLAEFVTQKLLLPLPKSETRTTQDR